MSDKLSKYVNSGTTDDTYDNVVLKTSADCRIVGGTLFISPSTLVINYESILTDFVTYRVNDVVVNNVLDNPNPPTTNDTRKMITRLPNLALISVIQGLEKTKNRNNNWIVSPTFGEVQGGYLVQLNGLDVAIQGNRTLRGYRYKFTNLRNISLNARQAPDFDVIFQMWQKLGVNQPLSFNISSFNAVILAGGEGYDYDSGLIACPNPGIIGNWTNQIKIGLAVYPAVPGIANLTTLIGCDSMEVYLFFQNSPLQ